MQQNKTNKTPKIYAQSELQILCVSPKLPSHRQKLTLNEEQNSIQNCLMVSQNLKADHF